jgi:hypothetical protein
MRPVSIEFDGETVVGTLPCGCNWWRDAGDLRALLSGGTLPEDHEHGINRCEQHRTDYDDEGRDASGNVVGERRTCRHCRHEIEYQGEGDWRDRGNGSECLPFHQAGEVVTPPAGQLHDPARS